MAIQDIAQQGYAIWRGSFRDVGAPPHWDQLTDRERYGFTAVAAFAINFTAEDAGIADSSLTTEKK